MALLTGEPRSASIVAGTDMVVYRLDRSHFDTLLSKSPHLGSSLSRILAQRLRSTTSSRVKAEKDLQAWRKQAVDSLEIDLSPAEEQQMLESLGNKSAPLAIFVGTMLDNIPEAIAIGLSAHTPQVGSAFLLAVFVSNFPESLTSSIGMRQAGYTVRRVVSLWGAQVLLSGLCALAGSLLFGIVPDVSVAIVQSIAGGAVLAMLSSTMMPEAYELGGGVVSLATILGFLTSFFISTSQLH